jgi:pyruvate carboxylase subunit A
MVGKLIVWGRTWDEVIRRSRRALNEFVIRGVPTTIPFFKKILTDPEFVKGQFDTSFIDRKIKEFTFIKEPDPEVLALALSAAIAVHHGL